MQIYSQAYMMKCPNLLKCIEEMVVNELVNPGNATLFYIDAIVFESQPIFEACEAIIQFNIDKIIEDEKASDFLLSLPFKRMHSLTKSDKLHVKNEAQLLALIDRYVTHRLNNKSLPLLAEETDAVIGAKKNWDELVKQNVLTAEEADAKKAAEKEQADKAAEEEKAR